MLLALRTTLQALGQKMIPIASSGVELFVKIIFGLFVIPAIGYIAVCIAEPIIWVACMLFLIVYCYKKRLFAKKGEISL